MKNAGILLVVVTMIGKMEVFAQESCIETVDWKIRAEIQTPGSQPALGLAGPLAGVHKNVLIIAGGANFPDSLPWEGGKKKYHAEIFVLKKEKLQWVKGINAALSETTAYGASVSLADGVLYMGGENEEGTSKKVTLVQWNEKRNTITTRSFPDLPIPLTNLMAATDGTIVYTGGGESADGPSSRFFYLDINNVKRGWQRLPDIPYAVSNAVMAIQSDGQKNFVYLVGGRKKNKEAVSSFYRSVIAFNIQSQKWEERSSMPEAKAAGTGIAFGKHHILLFGGDNGTTYNKTEELLLAISRENDPDKKLRLIDQKNKLQQSHPGFLRDVSVYNSKTNVWTKTDFIPFATPATTTALQWNDCVVIPSGEIRAGVRTPQILFGRFKEKNK